LKGEKHQGSPGIRGGGFFKVPSHKKEAASILLFELERVRGECEKGKSIAANERARQLGKASRRRGRWLNI